MNFIMYYLLRRFFVKLSFENKMIVLSKGIILVRTVCLPFDSIVGVSVKRTLLLRIFRCKGVEISTLGRKIKFYLKSSEELPFLPKKRGKPLKTSVPQQAFGAFISTRALVGTALFAGLLRRIGSVFGSDYYERAVNALFTVAEKVRDGLLLLHLAVPKITAAVGLLALLGWIFAYLKNFLSLKGHTLSRHGNFVFVSGGFITLYEHALVLNSKGATAEIRGSLLSVIAKRAPVYIRGVMLHPCIPVKRRRKFLRSLCGISVSGDRIVVPPPRAFISHCAMPVLWSAVFAAGIIFSEKRLHSELAEALFTAAFAAGVYTTLVYIVYMRRSGVVFSENITAVSSRRAMRFVTAYCRDSSIKSEKLSKLCGSSLCSYTVLLSDGSSRKARGLYLREIISR